MTPNSSPNMLKKQSLAQAEFSKLLKKVCNQDFYGTASITVNLQDGQIQYTRVLVDRIIR